MDSKRVPENTAAEAKRDPLGRLAQAAALGLKMSNQFELAGRLRKVIALADFLADQGCSAEMAAAMDQEQWRAIAKHAHVNMPSAETQSMVLERLRKMKVRVADTAPRLLEAPR